MLAVATLLYDAKYLPGALVLGHTLRKIAPPDVKLVVLIEKQAFEQWQLDLLGALWDDLVDTEVSESSLRKKLEHDLKRPELAKTYTKIELWNLPYERVLYLDADVLPLDGHNLVTDLLKLEFPRGKILAAPDSGFPDIFNSGVFALTPDPQDYARLSELVQSNGTDISFDGADQGLLNQYFNSDPDWVNRLLQAGETDVHNGQLHDSNWIRIPFLYNATPNAQYQYLPASNHFGYPGSDQGALSRPGIGPDSAKNAGFVDSVNVSPYENIALDHFLTSQSRSQVSVLHFIGAAKPWNNESSVIFKKWWSSWYEYSKGKSLEVVLRQQKYPISVNALLPPSASVNLSEIRTPADLCDPLKYQHIRSSIEAGSFWDATRQSPPPNAATNSNFALNRERYSNDWNDYKHEEEDHKKQAMDSAEVSRIFEPSSRKPGKARKGILKKRVGFGVHDSQVAERVFDERSDYTPHHLLMMTDRGSLVGEQESWEHGAEPSEGVTEQLSKASLEGSKSERKASVVQEPKGDPSGDSGVAKVFPWEYRGVEPERVWE